MEVPERADLEGEAVDAERHGLRVDVRRDGVGAWYGSARGGILLGASAFMYATWLAKGWRLRKLQIP